VASLIKTSLLKSTRQLPESIVW